MGVVFVILVILALALIGYAFQRGKANAAAPPVKMGREKGKLPVKSAALASAEAVATNWLVGISGPIEGKAFLIGRRRITIGRTPTNLIQVASDDVSRMHVQLTPQHGYLQIIDMSSHNGTYVNDERITDKPMVPGDVLRVGDAEFRLEMRKKGESEDAAMTRKEADASKFASTVTTSGAELVKMLRETLRETDGDFEQAGERLEVDPDLLRFLATSQEIDMDSL